MATIYLGADRRRAKPSPLMIGLALVGVATIAFATLCPADLRPHLATPNAERFDAYLVLGALVGLAAGRRALGATAVVVLLAVGLEAAQCFTPGRDPAISDALIKALGGVVGSAGVQLRYPLRRLVARIADFTPSFGAAARAR